MLATALLHNRRQDAGMCNCNFQQGCISRLLMAYPESDAGPNPGSSLPVEMSKQRLPKAVCMRPLLESMMWHFIPAIFTEEAGWEVDAADGLLKCTSVN